MPILRACHCCGLIHELPHLTREQSAYCTRCRACVARGGDAGERMTRTAALALAALILFWPAILLPILETERLGHRHASNILLGAIDMLIHGELFVGMVVLLFSVVFPLAKIVILLELSCSSMLQKRHKAWTYRCMEIVGKWSMMDVMLLALLVMLVKLGNLVVFHLGPAVVAFVLCVAASMLASASFDPHAVWEDPAP